MFRVLLVDDEPSLRFTMSEFLKRDGYEVRAVSDYAEAAAVGNEHVDVAVVDVNLPGGSGVDLLRQFSGREPYVPVIMITGEPTLSLLPDIVRAGAYDFIAKPVVKDVLLRAVARASEKKRLTEEKGRLEQEVRRHAEELETRVAERTAELLAAHTRLDRQEKIASLGRIAAQVAHEVKNPLAGLLLYSMHLRDRVAAKLPDDELRLIDKIIETTRYMDRTCEQVLDFARPISLTPLPADLNLIVADVLHILEPQLAAGAIERRLELGEPEVAGVLDQTSIRGALTNLILNAVQAMPSGGTLAVKTLRADGALKVEVSDTGVGMNEEQLGNIFEPFYSTKSRGLGLGMPYVRKVVEEHRGTIQVESRPSAGTTIRVSLPVGAEGVSA
ncbi:MAG TPA: ATP-binding protein [Pyrinomonadaceae bacterium]